MGQFYRNLNNVMGEKKKKKLLLAILPLYPAGDFSVANTTFVGARSAAGMGFFPGKQLNFWEAMRVVAGAIPVRLSWAGRAGRDAAADRCMSVLHCTARPAVQHLPAAPPAPGAPRLCRNGLWARCDSTEGACVALLCGTVGQWLPAAPQGSGSELHPCASNTCSRNIPHPLLSPKQHTALPKSQHSTWLGITKDYLTFPFLFFTGSEVKASRMLCSGHCPHSLALCCAGISLVSPVEWQCQGLWWIIFARVSVVGNSTLPTSLMELPLNSII